MEGYIKLHREIMDWEWYSDFNTYRLFIHLLLKANWKPGRYKGVEVGRGELVTTYPMLSSETGLSIKMVRTALGHLVSTGEVLVKRQAKFSVITIQNYKTYQSPDARQEEGSQQTVNEQENNSQTVDRGQTKNNKKARKHQQNENQGAEEGQFHDNQTAMNGSQGAVLKEEEKKEIKKENNKKEFCQEAECSAPDSTSVAAFILKDGSLYDVSKSDFEIFKQLYPGIDCMQELRNVTGWCLANPKKRKTRSGAKRFLNGWLMRAQNSTRPEKKPQSVSSASPSKNRFHNFDQTETDYGAVMMKKLQARMAKDG